MLWNIKLSSSYGMKANDALFSSTWKTLVFQTEQNLCKKVNEIELKGHSR